jgi:PIN domain nuclease of toxin-antitoxin system
VSGDRVLLDTHILLWVLNEADRLSLHHRTILAEDPTLVVSAVSIWEIAIKSTLGKLAVKGDVLDTVRSRNAEFLSITPKHAAYVARVPRLHGDPFDRLLVAQAICEGLPLMSVDSRLQEYGVEIV